MGTNTQSDKQKFGQWLRDFRYRRGFQSAASLSRMADLAVSHVSMIERGEVLPRFVTASRLAKALRLNDEEIAQLYSRLERARRTPEVARMLSGERGGVEVGHFTVEGSS